jgi:hypothetical protein
VPGGRKIEGWEWSFFILAAAVLYGVVQMARKPSHTPIYDWARDEAEERLRRRLEGLPVEFGYNYAALRGESRSARLAMLRVCQRGCFAAIAERTGKSLEEE